MRWAYLLARDVLPEYSSCFSRHDFTLPQLFACLVVREHQRKSYRGTEALLGDCRPWCRAIGMRKVPDHNTLCRAFHVIVRVHHIDHFLDCLCQWFRIRRMLGSVLAIDSSLYDTHHRSRHYEQRCRHQSSNHRETADARRSVSCRKTPKLSIGADTASHVIVSAKPRTGMGADYSDFVPVVWGACRRGRFRKLLADAGYDSEANHRLARHELGLESLIKAGSGKPTSKPPPTLWRRMMKQKLAGSQKGQAYGQRSQVETVNSMMKRNLGDSLRAASTGARQMEQLLRVVVHDVMIFLLRFHRVETEPDANSFSRRPAGTPSGILP
jgi:hypothetical protein